MYKCKYSFWDEKHFPGFQNALSDLYDRSIYNYLYNEKHDKKDRDRDLSAIYKVFPLIEYYYVSLIKLGYIDKKNYSNILNQLKSIECISVLKPGALRGVTIGNKISINLEIKPYNELNGEDMFKLTVFHELGHIICNSWADDVHMLCDRIFRNNEIRAKLNSYGIKSKNDLVNGFVLLEDVLVQEAGEDVLYRSKEMNRPGFMYYQSSNFPGIKFRSNYTMYQIFQELGLKFFRCLKTCDCFQEKTVSSALKKSCLNGFRRNFINNLEDEMNTDIEKFGDFAVMIGCLGKIKNVSYSDFGLGVETDLRENSYYYDLFLQVVNDKIIRNTNENKNVY